MVAGAALPDEALLGYADEVREPVVEFGLTFFEAVTVLAFHAFAREGVEVAAIEVGLGGRLDATNVLAPEVAAVTNVAMDHADYLGDTLGEIAAREGRHHEAGRPVRHGGDGRGHPRRVRGAGPRGGVAALPAAAGCGA